MPRPLLVLTILVSTLAAALPPGAAAPAETPPTADFTYAPSTFYAGDEVELASVSSASAPILSYAWSIETAAGTVEMGGERVRVAFPAAGAYRVTHAVTDALLRTSNVTRILVADNAPPEAAFTVEPDVVARGVPVAFRDASTDRDHDAIVAWSWAFGDGATSSARDPSHAYGELGHHTVALTVQDATGRESTSTRAVHVVNRAPVVDASYSPAHPEVAERVRFDATGMDPDGPGSALAYEWSFSDGATMLGASVERAFAVRGTYAATLRATDAEGASSEPITLVVHVSAPRPVAAFHVEPGVPTVGDAARFLDDSTSAGEIHRWSWDFGDGAWSTERTPSHAYARGGLYQVTLAVETTDGAVDAETRVVRANEPPVARFDAATTAAIGAPVSFADRSTDAEGAIVAWAWDFGDGATSAARDAVHAFSAPGLYVVRLAVTDADGATREAARGVRVENRAPVAAFAIDGAPIAQSPVSFESLAYDPDGAPLSWSWSFGDGATSPLEHPAHTYAQSGRHVVALRVSDGHDASIASRTLAVGAPHALVARLEAVLPDGRPADLRALDEVAIVLARPEGNVSLPLAFDDLGAWTELPAGAWMRGDALVASAHDALLSPRPATLSALPSDGTAAITFRLQLATPVHASIEVAPGERAGLGLGSARAPDGTPVYRDAREGFHGAGAARFADDAPAAGASVTIEAHRAGESAWCLVATTVADEQGAFTWQADAGAPCGPPGATPPGRYELRATPAFPGATSIEGAPETARVDPLGGLLG